LQFNGNGFVGYGIVKWESDGEPRRRYQGVIVNDALYSDKVQVERKQFFFELKENARGRFLRITEDVNGRRNAIVIPSGGLEEFARIIGDTIEQNKRLAPAPTAVS
jgi:hypothetical protein